MPQLRSERLNVDATSYYHLMSRCVRRAFLCGNDPHTGKDFGYRREWIEHRIFELASIFAVDLHAYAVMSNHLHIVVRVDKDRAEAWSDSEVIRRYGKLFGRKPSEIASLPARERKSRISIWRERLWNLSWMMRCLNESIARRANAEDECTGRFWEGRFRCQPLLDETAVLTCMAYVDLNPVRAGLVKSLRASKHTSIAKRIKQAEATGDAPAGLVPFADQTPARSRRTTAPMHYDDYLELLTWTGRNVRAQSARGSVPELLVSLGIDPGAFLALLQRPGLQSATLLGRLDALESFVRETGKQWAWGKRIAKALSTTSG
ncbi:MAG: hypothetical protein AAGE52_29145 [Myxococcota bacterium]